MIGSVGSMTFVDHSGVNQVECLATSLEIIEENSNLVLFPNPSSYSITVEFDEPGLQHVRLIDALGNVVMEKQHVGNSLDLNVSALPIGIYVIERFGGAQRARVAINR